MSRVTELDPGFNRLVREFQEALDSEQRNRARGVSDLPLFTPRPSGSELRDRGMALVDEAENPAWKAKADAAIRELASSGREFTAEDLRALVGDPLRPNSMGSAFQRAARAGLVKYIRHQKSNRPSLQSCAIRVWVGVTK